MFTKAFWVATGGRVVQGAASGVLTGLSLSGAGPVNAFDYDPQLAAGFAVGGALTALLICLVSAPLGGAPSPSLTPKAEVDSALAPLREE